MGIHGKGCGSENCSISNGIPFVRNVEQLEVSNRLGTDEYVALVGSVKAEKIGLRKRFDVKFPYNAISNKIRHLALLLGAANLLEMSRMSAKMPICPISAAKIILKYQ
jgi:hypothetical protein